MSHEQLQRPVTYGDVFPATQFQGQVLADQPITMEDASLMQSAEAMTFGKTQKGGAASVMQAAASKNVDQGLVERKAHSLLAEFGMTVAQTALPGAVMDVSYVAGSPVAATAHPTPTDPAIAALDAVTIGEALEAAAVGAGDRPMDENDASAILSAEAHATGMSRPIKGGVGSVAQSAAELNQRVVNPNEKTTLADVLTDATVALPADKVVTREDAEKIIQAELRHKPPSEGIAEGGVGAAIAAAAELNERIGLIQPPPGAVGAPGQNVIQSHEHPELLHSENKYVHEDVVEVGKFYPVDNSAMGTNQTPAAGKSEEASATPPATPQSPIVDPATIPSARDQPSADELMAPLTSSADDQGTNTGGSDYGAAPVSAVQQTTMPTSAHDQPSASLTSSASHHDQAANPLAGDQLYTDELMTPLIPSAGDEASVPRASDQPSADDLMTPLYSSDPATAPKARKQPSTDEVTTPVLPSPRDHPSADELTLI
ncbi:hypothetical protein R1flu_024137 [Riccia fluitans]|uniref:SMP domain-containing protein n=1 Tax=Riccia fluitans TaxID=41844 RepID=A0ABD1XUH0_9MARC